MIELNEISKLGIGTYRMSINTQEHRISLKYALDSGINLIDTASNYQSGNSEKLIGSLLNKSIRDEAFVISKAGYVQGNDINTFSKVLKTPRTYKISDNFLYSLDEKFLEAQLNASLKRLNTDYLDGFLIHNPEHFYSNKNKNKSHFYNYLIDSFLFLEKMVKKGVIRYYGISSNVLPINDIDIKKVVNESNSFSGFKLVQFPFNLIENEAAQELNGGSLISFCKRNNLKTLSNRPLNTTYNGKVLRLADYSSEYKNVNLEKEQVIFEELLHIIQHQLEKFGETSKPEDFTPIKFFIENRRKIANPEAVSKAITGHLLPFLQQIQLKEVEISKIINKLSWYWILFSKKYITQRANELKNAMVSKGELLKNDDRDISLIACDNYLNRGIDHVLVGMRNNKYVDNLLSLL